MFRENRKDLSREEMRLKSGDVAYQETFHGIHEWQCRHWRDSPQAPTTSQRQRNPPNLPDTEVCGKNIGNPRSGAPLTHEDHPPGQEEGGPRPDPGTCSPHVVPRG